MGRPDSGAASSSSRAAKPVPWPAVVVIALLAAPILFFMNVVTLSGAAAAAVLVAQNARDSRVEGVITDSSFHGARSRWGGASTESYCWGYFDSDAGDIRQRPVRIYLDGDCSSAQGVSATLVAGAGWPTPTDATPPLNLDGLFGMSDGAAVGRPHSFWWSLWPFLFLVPFTVLIDVSVGYGVRHLLATSRARRGSTPTVP